MKYLIDIDGHDGAAPTTLRWGTHGLWDGDAYYEPRVLNPGNFERHMFSPKRTSGESRVGFGEAVTANQDGAFDHLRGWGFAGRTFRLRKTGTTAAAAVETFVGTVEQPAVTWDEVVWRLRDRLEDLRKPLQTNRYAGSTVNGGLDEAEGTEDLKGRPKPVCDGRNSNVPAVLANAFDLVYQVNDGAVTAVPAVYDAGVCLPTYAGDYPTLAALIAADLPRASWATCLAEGYFRLGSPPVGLVTADVTVGATAADRTAAQAALHLLDRAGIPPEDIDAASFAALDALNAAEIGLWVADDRTALDVLTEVLGSVGGWLSPTRLGVFQVGRLDAPAGEPALTLTLADLPDGTSLAPEVPDDEGRGVPAWKAVVGFGRNWTPMTGREVLEGPCVTEDRRAWLAAEYREAAAEDAAVKATHPLAPALRFDTLLVERAAAEAEAARRLSLYGVPRAVWPVPVTAEVAGSVDIGAAVSLDVPRFGCAGGRLLRVIGVVEDYGRSRGTIIGWGGV